MRVVGILIGIHHSAGCVPIVNSTTPGQPESSIRISSSYLRFPNQRRPSAIGPFGFQPAPCDTSKPKHSVLPREHLLLVRSYSFGDYLNGILARSTAREKNRWAWI